MKELDDRDLKIVRTWNADKLTAIYELILFHLSCCLLGSVLNVATYYFSQVYFLKH